MHLLHMVVCRRRKEQELEKIEAEHKEKSMEDQECACEEDHRQTSYFKKTGRVQPSTNEVTDAKRNILEIKIPNTISVGQIEEYIKEIMKNTGVKLNFVNFSKFEYYYYNVINQQRPNYSSVFC